MRRRWSINTLLLAGMGGMLLSGVVMSAGVSEAVIVRGESRRGLLIYYAQIYAHARDHLLAMVNQQVGLRGYLPTGDRRFLDTYARGREEEQQAMSALEIKLRPEDRDALGDARKEVERHAAEWRIGYAEPQLRLRETGQNFDLVQIYAAGQDRFDLIRAAHARLAEDIRRAAERASADADAAIQWIRTLGQVITGVLVLLGVLVIRALLRQIARPLVELERRASAQEPFPPALPGGRVREVARLQEALHDLDRTARERERQRAQVTTRAVAFNAFGEFVQQLVDETELHQALARAVDDTMAPDTMQMLVRNASRNRLEVTWPEPLPPDEIARHPILADPMRCRAVRTLRPVYSDVRASTACSCPLGVPAEGSYCCLPMVAAGDLVGVVNLKAKDEGRFTRESLEAGQGYINFASTTLSSIRLLASTRERALRDSLTGAYNRAFLSEYLGKQISLVGRRRRQLAVLVCDLDHFKLVNDRYGHPIGDRALVAFSALLHHSVRNGDAVVRYGGEEFVVVLVDTDLDGARAVAERIRSGAEHIIVNDGADTIGAIVRTSIGVAVFPEHGRDEASLIGAADRAVYRAKREGRNRVVVADPLAEDPDQGARKVTASRATTTTSPASMPGADSGERSPRSTDSTASGECPMSHSGASARAGMVNFP